MSDLRASHGQSNLALMASYLREIHTDKVSVSGLPLTSLGLEFDLATWSSNGQACAIGHAMRDDRFNALGLSVHDRGEPEPQYQMPECDEVLFGWDAAHLFFGISEVDCESLFSQDRYADSNPTPLQVALEVESFLSLEESN